MADLLEIVGALLQFIAFALISALCGSLLFLAIIELPELIHTVFGKRSIRQTKAA